MGRPELLVVVRGCQVVDGILVPGGFGERGIEGKIASVKYAREKKIPYLGLCLGMQVAVIEFARSVAGLKKAHSSEFEPESEEAVISLLSGQTANGLKGSPNQKRRLARL